MRLISSGTSSQLLLVSVPGDNSNGSVEIDRFEIFAGPMCRERFFQNIFRPRRRYSRTRSGPSLTSAM